MADTYSMDQSAGYQSTNTYRNASPERRRQINKYKKELGISDEHMFLLMFQKDLEAVPESDRKGGDTVATVMIVVGVLLLWNTLQTAMSSTGGASVTMIFVGLASFGLVCFIYFSGILNPYKRAVREVNKRLKDQPTVQDFDEWDLQNPNKADRKATKAKNGKRR